MDRPDREPDALLVAYREGDKMPAADKQAAWMRLQAALAAEVDDVHEDMPQRTDGSALRRRRTAGWTIAALLAAAVLLVIAGRGRLLGVSAPTDSRQQAVHDADEPPLGTVQPASRAGVSPASTTPTSVPAPPPDPSKPTAVRAGSRPTRDDPADLDAELALLRGARAALAESRTAEALALLGEHAQRFPGGHLVEERTLLRVQALCEGGARAQARAEAETFARAQPGSPHAKKIVRLCAVGSTDPSDAGK